jgi:LacI family transcriptional regulator
MSKITVRQVARLAGVSRSTVSRVLNNSPHVRPEVRERVQEIIAETGYHPDPIARLLSSQRSGIIGLVVPLAAQELFDDPYFSYLIQGASQACNTHDLILSLSIFHSKQDEVKLYPRIFRNQLFDGAIVTATRIGDPLVLQLLENEVPFVLCGRHADPRVSFVDVDNVAGSYAAVTHLIALGHRRIATITGPSDNRAALDRKQGYLEALKANRYETEEQLIVAGDFSEMSGYQAMRGLREKKPDAVFVASDAMALGALRALREAGITVPDEIALVSFDDLPQAATASPKLTTVRQPIEETGSLAVETLIDIMDNGQHPPRRISLPTELVIRTSCGSE